MPTYTYQCDDCQAAFEQFQKFSEAPLTECPSCHGAIRRVIHPVGIVFKGTGWYINDSRGNKTDSALPASTPAKSESTATPATETASTSASSGTSTTSAETRAAV